MKKLIKKNNLNSSFKYYIKYIDNEWSDIFNNINIFKHNNKYLIIKTLNSNKIKKEGVILKFHKDNLEDYEIGKKLEKLHGFIKYICYIKYDKDFLSLLYDDIKLNYNNYDIIIMPYYNYTIASYEWNNDNDFINCLKQIVLSYHKAYFEENILIIDLHVHNILLDIKSNKKNVRYDLFDMVFNITDNKIDIKICDYENSKIIYDINNNYILFYNILIDIFNYFKDDYYNIINIINYINENKCKKIVPCIMLNDIINMINNCNRL